MKGGWVVEGWNGGRGKMGGRSRVGWVVDSRWKSDRGEAGGRSRHGEGVVVEEGSRLDEKKMVVSVWTGRLSQPC